jgi:hypothetical protein
MSLRDRLFSGTLGGAQSFGVTESATVSPKVCAPGESDFAGDMWETASAVPEADNLNPFKGR